MSTYSVAQARNQLSDLIDRALAGEGVVISRHGRPVIEFRPVEIAVAPVSSADLDWLAARRIGVKPALEDAAALVSRMRDDEER